MAVPYLLGTRAPKKRSKKTVVRVLEWYQTKRQASIIHPELIEKKSLDKFNLQFFWTKKQRGFMKSKILYLYMIKWFIWMKNCTIPYKHKKRSLQTSKGKGRDKLICVMEHPQRDENGELTFDRNIGH